MSLGPLMIDLQGTTLGPEEREWLMAPEVGGVILFTRNYSSPEQLEELVSEIHALRHPALLVAVDHEGGRVQRFGAPFTRLPAARTLGHLYDESRRDALATAAALGWLMAAELRAMDVDLSFAPVVDLDLGLSEVIGDRALHESSEAVCELALKFASGAHAAGMAVTAKHFPTHAGARNDSHVSAASDGRALEDLTEDLEPYRRLIAAGLQAVMVGHVSFPRVSAEPASLSPWWIGGELRGELGFSGAVIADDMSMKGAIVGGAPAERVEKALAAGCDMVLLCNAPDAVPAVLERLHGYVNPPSQLRLMRLRGRAGMPWETLTGSKAWREARHRLQRLTSRPTLRLEG
jgi:beta-N-acetylhexosaminidase